MIMAMTFIIVQVRIMNSAKLVNTAISPSYPADVNVNRIDSIAENAV